MSQSARHARIGFFVLFGFFLIFATAIYVGSIRLFANEIRVLFYFDESVNGLSVGSPVKFKGVTIGTVSDILLAYDQDRSTEASFIPVFAKIDLGRLHRNLGLDPTIDFQDDDVFDAQVVEGLRAKLEMISFITGQLYVELDYFAPPGSEFRVVQRELNFREIPTVPSTMAEFGSSASSIMAKLASLDIKGINDALREALGTLNTKLVAMETDKWNSAVLGLTEDFGRIARDLDLAPLLEELSATNAALNSLVTRLDGAIEPAVEGYDAVVTDSRQALAQIDLAFRRVDELVAANSGFGRDLELTLREVREAARSLRELLEFLERNPRALLSGRPQP
jgi:paraquat-inducible protein B